MKKIAAGFLAGAMLMVSAQAWGAADSLVGKKIEAEYDVNVYGKKLVDSAIIINGKSYAPVRAIGELAGYCVSYSDKSINLDEKNSGASSLASGSTASMKMAQGPTTTQDPVLTAARNKINAIDDKIDAVVESILVTGNQLKADAANPELKLKLEQYKLDYANLQKQKELELLK